jgi:hypothetical protein
VQFRRVVDGEDLDDIAEGTDAGEDASVVLIGFSHVLEQLERRRMSAQVARSYDSPNGI